MLDVRHATARILDKYTLADVVGITLRKLKRDNVSSPFLPLAELVPLFADSPPELPDNEQPSHPRKAGPLSINHDLKN